MADQYISGIYNTGQFNAQNVAVGSSASIVNVYTGPPTDTTHPASTADALDADPLSVRVP